MTADFADLPLAGCTFGRAKRMKTSTMLSAFCCGVFIGDPQRIVETAEAEYGFTPYVWGAEVGWDGGLYDALTDIGFEPSADLWTTEIDLDKLLAVMEFLAYDIGHDALVDIGVNAVGVDDISLIARRSLSQWDEDKYLVENLTKGAKVNDFWPYIQVAKRMVRFTPTGKAARLHFWSTAHMQDPEPEKGKKGGADFGSSGQVEKVTAWLSSVVMAETDETWPDPWGAIAVVKHDWRDKVWVYNDSRRALVSGLPLNIREAARAAKRAPVTLARLVGLEWQDDMADDVAAALADGDAQGPVDIAQTRDLAASFLDRARDYTDQADLDLLAQHVRWAFQDGMARWAYARRPGLFDFTAVKAMRQAARGGRR